MINAPRFGNLSGFRHWTSNLLEQPFRHRLRPIGPRFDPFIRATGNRVNRRRANNIVASPTAKVDTFADLSAKVALRKPEPEVPTSSAVLACQRQRVQLTPILGKPLGAVMLEIDIDHQVIVKRDSCIQTRTIEHPTDCIRVPRGSINSVGVFGWYLADQCQHWPALGCILQGMLDHCLTSQPVCQMPTPLI